MNKSIMHLWSVSPSPYDHLHPRMGLPRRLFHLSVAGPPRGAPADEEEGVEIVWAKAARGVWGLGHVFEGKHVQLFKMKRKVGKGFYSVPVN